MRVLKEITSGATGQTARTLSSHPSPLPIPPPTPVMAGLITVAAATIGLLGAVVDAQWMGGKTEAGDAFEREMW